jgi:hypothetical protein
MQYSQSILDTAELFGDTPAETFADCVLSYAVEKCPTISLEPSKEDALKLLAEMLRKAASKIRIG